MKYLIDSRLKRIDRFYTYCYIAIVFLYIVFWSYNCAFDIIDNSILLMTDKMLMVVIVFPFVMAMENVLYDIGDLYCIRAGSKKKVNISRIITYICVITAMIFINYIIINIVGFCSFLLGLEGHNINIEAVSILSFLYESCGMPVFIIIYEFIYALLGLLSVALWLDIIHIFINSQNMIYIIGIFYVIGLMHNSGGIFLTNYHLVTLNMVIPNVTNVCVVLIIDFVSIMLWMVINKVGIKDEKIHKKQDD